MILPWQVNKNTTALKWAGDRGGNGSSNFASYRPIQGVLTWTGKEKVQMGCMVKAPWTKESGQLN
jgi:hypothetical protein